MTHGQKTSIDICNYRSESLFFAIAKLFNGILSPGWMAHKCPVFAAVNFAVRDKNAYLIDSIRIY